MEKGQWSRPRGILILGANNQSEQYKCPFHKIGCEGILEYSDLKTTSQQVLCRFCGNVWVNPNNLSIRELSHYRLISAEKDWFFKKVAENKIQLPDKKPNILRRIYLTLKWYL